MSIDEIIREVSSIKMTSDQLSVMVGAANSALANQSSRIASLVKGSQSGQDAVMALSVAARALADAASSMRAVSRACEESISTLSK